MSLTNEQYNLILREYDSRRLKARHELEERIKKAEQKIPALRSINQQIASSSVTYAKLSLSKEAVDFKELSVLNHSLSLEKEHLLEANGFPRDYLKLQYHCPFCKDTGFDKSQKRCRCFQQTVMDLLYSQSFLQKQLKKENFSTFRYDFYQDLPDPEHPREATPLQNIKKAVQTCKKFIDLFSSDYKNVLIHGKTGVGKTFLSNCIANELLQQGYTIIYLSAPQLFEIIEQYKFTKSKTDTTLETAESKMQYILTCDFLIIDDLGTEFNNSFLSSQLYYCINERFLRQKSMLISTNLTLDEIRESYSDRIFSRLCNDYVHIKLYGQDIRIKKAIIENPELAIDY